MVRKFITHTYTDESGAVVLVKGVPAWCDDSQSPPVQLYDWDVTEQLNTIIKTALGNASPQTVYITEYENKVSSS
jgi:hypothetical protein